MAGPDTPHVCLEVHPDVSHFMWAASAKLAEKKATQQAISSDEPVFTMPDDGVDYSEFAVDAWGDDDDTGQSPYGSYVEQQRAACKDISFEEIFLALERKGTIWKTERPISAWRGDSNKFMCPDSSHDNPGASSFSAWGSKEKGLWTCTLGCGAGSGGGDKFVLAYYLYDDFDYHRVAERLAFEFRGIKKPEKELKQEAPPSIPTEEEFEQLDPTPAVPPQAYVEIIGEKAYLEEITSKEQIIVSVDEVISQAEPQTPYNWDEHDPDSDKVTAPSYKWEDVLAFSPNKETFLHAYCLETEKDTTPSQFNLFNGLSILGLIAGNYVLGTDVYPLSANFGVVLVAPSGGGKTRSVRHMKTILREITPWRGTMRDVKIITSAYSGPYLVSQFINEETNDIGDRLRIPVKGLVEYSEFSELTKAASSTSANIKEKIHDLLDHDATLEYGSLGQKHMIAEKPFGSIITTTQTSRLRDLFSKADAASGFMNRFIFVMGTAKPQKSLGGVELDFGPAKLKALEVKAHVIRERILGWTPDAELFLDQVFTQYIVPVKESDGRDIMTRLDLTFKKLIIAFAINDLATVIQIHHVSMAAALLPYLVACYGGVIKKAMSHEFNEISEWLHRRIYQIERKNYNRLAAEWESGDQELPFLPENYGPNRSELKREYTSYKDWKEEDVDRAMRSLITSATVTAKMSTNARGAKKERYYTDEIPSSLRRPS